MSILFTNSENNTIEITHIELTQILTNSNATNNYYVNANNDLVYVRISSGILLLMDLLPNININIRLFELFSIKYEISNPFFIKIC